MFPDFCLAQATLVHELKNQPSSREETREVRTMQERINALKAELFEEEPSFFPTVTLSGEAVWGVIGIVGQDVNESVVFSGSVELNFEVSFTEEDSLEIGLESGNFVEFSIVEELTQEGRVGFVGDTEENRFELSELSYEFPINDRLSFYLSTTGDDLEDFNPFFESRNGNSGGGAISDFGAENPIHNLVEDVGIQLNYDLTEEFSIGVGYFSEDGNDPETGLFNGNHSSFVQLEYEPSDNFLLGFTYIHSYNDSSLGTDTGSLRSQLELDRPIVGNSYGLSASWMLNPKIAVGGWVGFTHATVLDLGEAQIWNYALTLTFPEFGSENNLLGIVLGQEPKLTGTSGFTIDDRRQDPDTSFHLEAFYIHQVNDNLSLTPGIIWITSPNHDRNSKDFFLFTLRTTFEF